MLYIIADRDRTVAKLGFSKNPLRRLKQLQTANALTLELLATYPGTPTDERHAQRWLCTDRIKGEWFEWGPKIETILDKWSNNRGVWE